MTHAEKLAVIVSNFNNGQTVVLITHKHTELYNVKLHSENMLLNALNNAVAVRLI